VVTPRLVDRATGAQLWGEEYHTGPSGGHRSGSLDDIARVIAARVGGEHGVLVQALLQEYRRRPTAPGPYGAILRAYGFLLTRDVRELAPAVAALLQVVDREPENTLAWSLLARLYQVNYSGSTRIRVGVALS
jgi:hypothetical protein